MARVAWLTTGSAAAWPVKDHGLAVATVAPRTPGWCWTCRSRAGRTCQPGLGLPSASSGWIRRRGRGRPGRGRAAYRWSRRGRGRPCTCRGRGRSAGRSAGPGRWSIPRARSCSAELCSAIVAIRVSPRQNASIERIIGKSSVPWAVGLPVRAAARQPSERLNASVRGYCSAGAGACGQGRTVQQPATWRNMPLARRASRQSCCDRTIWPWQIPVPPTARGSFTARHRAAAATTAAVGPPGGCCVDGGGLRWYNGGPCVAGDESRCPGSCGRRRLRLLARRTEIAFFDE